jgi:ribosome-binding factor A
MPRRTEQLAHALRDVVGRYLQKEVEFPHNTLVTITSARVSGDGRTTMLCVSVLPAARGAEVLQILQDERYAVQGMVHRAVDRHPAPEIQFELVADAPGKSGQGVTPKTNRTRHS